MKLSLRSEYALLSLIHLARNSGTTLLPEIAAVGKKDNQGQKKFGN